MIPFAQALGNSGNEDLTFSRKRPPATLREAQSLASWEVRGKRKLKRQEQNKTIRERRQRKILTLNLKYRDVVCLLNPTFELVPQERSLITESTVS